MSEKEQLIELAGQPLGARIKGYLKLSGPGYMQSAMTLGGGSIASCVLMGSLLGYQLLWVQPLAIFLGVCVLAAVAKQTCHTGEKPYDVFWKRLHPAMAIAWGVASLVATVLWHIPQYSLTANGAVELASGIGLDLSGNAGRGFIGVVVLLAAGFVCYLYSTGARGLKIYETLVKVLVWGIVGAFAVVTFATGIDLKELILGFTGISFIQYVMEFGFPEQAIIPVVGGIAAAVGINMVFLYPYSLLNKNWGKEHRELAYFDLLSGMMVPFILATAFMMIAVANTIGPEPGQLAAESLKDIRAILPVLDETLGSTVSLLLIGLGMFAIGFSTIITHMLASGFIGCELFGFEYRGKAKFWFSLLPAIGIVAAVLGVIKAMGALDQSPEILGGLIGAALVGTFVGIFASYGMIGPIATKVKGVREKKNRLFIIVKQTLLAYMNGALPQVALEFGRKTISAHDRPSIDAVEQQTLNTAAEKAA